MRLHYREQGEGPPLVILHGLFGSFENWAYISQQLSDEFRVISVDQRNHGQSPHDPEMNFPALGKDLGDFLDQLQLERANVLGHSLGGKAAMEFALTRPGRAERLIVVDMAPRGYPRKHDRIFEALRSLRLESFHTRGEIEEALEPAIPELAVRRFLLKGLAQRTPGEFSWKFNLPVLHESYDQLTAPLDRGRSCDCPALFIRGADSDYIRAGDEALIRELFPRAEMTTIEGAGHWVHAEQPQVFIDRVKNFLRGNF
jgi:esterase